VRHPAALMLVILCAVGCRSDSQSPAGATVQIERLRFVLPPGWHQVPANSTMRVAQASIPGPGTPAELAVFHFGAGRGGDVESNLERWMNQIEPAPGDTPQRETFDSGGLRITWIDARGTLKPGQMGMGPAVAQADSRLLGAVIEGDGGPWFFKATGADATLAPQRDAFVAMLKSLTSTAQ